MKITLKDLKQIISEEFRSALNEQASHRARQVAEMIMSGEAAFHQAAEQLRPIVYQGKTYPPAATMEDVNIAIVEKYNEMLPQFMDAERIRKAGYDQIFGNPGMDQTTSSEAIRKANHEIEILKIPFYNVFQFYHWAVSPDEGMPEAPDIADEVSKLLDIKDLYKIVPGLQYYAHGGEGSGFEDPFFEHIIREELQTLILEATKSEISWFGEVFDELLQNPQNAFSRSWIVSNIGSRIGGGYSREVYNIKDRDELVFKVASQRELQDGSYTNLEEKKYFNKYPDYFPRVHMTAPEQKGMTKRKSRWPQKTFSGILWLIVDKVETIVDDVGYEETILKAFPVINRFYKILNANEIRVDKSDAILNPISIFELMMDASAHEQFHKQLTSYIYGGLSKFVSTSTKKAKDDSESNRDFHQKSASKIMNRFDSQEALDGFIDRIYLMLRKGFANFLRMIKETGVDVMDIRPGNVGTDIATKSKFIILDISKFLNNYLKSK